MKEGMWNNRETVQYSNNNSRLPIEVMEMKLPFYQSIVRELLLSSINQIVVNYKYNTI